VAFTWPPAGGATNYTLLLGSTGPGSYNLWDSGATTATSLTFSAMPVNGETIYARLSTNFNGTLVHSDSTYTAANPIFATMISPLPGSTLAGASVTFKWAPGATATIYQLQLGTTGVGSSDVYNSGSITATSVTANKLPTTGITVYVRLRSESGGTWSYLDYTYVAK